MIEVKDITKVYGQRKNPLIVLDQVSFVVPEGQIVAVVGASGSGKSTLLNILGGLDTSTKGFARIDSTEVTRSFGKDLSQYRAHTIGFIFQFHYLLPDFNALENVYLPFLAQNNDRELAKSRAEELLNEVGLSDRLTHKPGELSGGEQQRVAIARSLINKPRVILADEPTGNLDKKNTEAVHDLLWSLRDIYKLTILIVTHDPSISNRADRVLKLDKGTITEDITASNRIEHQADSSTDQ